MVHSPAAARWAAIIDRQEASGLTIRAFASMNDLNPSTLSWWRSRLGRADAVEEQPRFTEIDVRYAQQLRGDGTVVVALERINAHVVVDQDTDLHLLRMVVDALC